MKKIISLLASTAIMLMVLPAGTAMATGSCTLTDSGGATATFNQGNSATFDLFIVNFYLCLQFYTSVYFILFK